MKETDFNKVIEKKNRLSELQAILEQQKEFFTAKIEGRYFFFNIKRIKNIKQAFKSFRVTNEDVPVVFYKGWLFNDRLSASKGNNINHFLSKKDIKELYDYYGLDKNDSIKSVLPILQEQSNVFFTSRVAKGKTENEMVCLNNNVLIFNTGKKDKSIESFFHFMEKQSESGITEINQNMFQMFKDFSDFNYIESVEKSDRQMFLTMKNGDIDVFYDSREGFIKLTDYEKSKKIIENEINIISFVDRSKENEDKNVFINKEYIKNRVFTERDKFFVSNGKNLSQRMSIIDKSKIGEIQLLDEDFFMEKNKPLFRKSILCNASTEIIQEIAEQDKEDRESGKVDIDIYNKVVLNKVSLIDKLNVDAFDLNFLDIIDYDPNKSLDIVLFSIIPSRYKIVNGDKVLKASNSNSSLNINEDKEIIFTHSEIERLGLIG